MHEFIMFWQHSLNDSSSSRGNATKGVDVCHNVVPTLLLFNGSDLELFRGEVLKITIGSEQTVNGRRIHNEANAPSYHAFVRWPRQK